MPKYVDRATYVFRWIGEKSYVSLLIAAVSVAYSYGVLSRSVADMEEELEDLSAKAAEGVEPPQVTSLDALPPGTVLISYDGEVDPAREYGINWVKCGGAGGSPELDGLLLVGGSQEGVGRKVGSESHSHRYRSQTSEEIDAQFPAAGPGRPDPRTGEPRRRHIHEFLGVSEPAASLPPAYTVLFVCKIG